MTELDIKIGDQTLRLYFGEHSFRDYVQDPKQLLGVLYDAAIELDNPEFEITLKPFKD